MVSRPKGITVLGWLFTGFGLWGLLSIPLDLWMARSKDFETVASLMPFYKQFFVMRMLPMFYPATAIAALLMLVAGLGFLRGKPWARGCAFVYIGFAAISGTMLYLMCFRLLGKNGSGWNLWFGWAVLMVILGSLAFYLTRSAAKVKLPIWESWKAYEQIHWKLVCFGMRAFGAAAAIVGSIICIWGITLLLTANSTVLVEGLPTTDVTPKLTIIFSALLLVVIGVLCLRFPRTTRGLNSVRNDKGNTSRGAGSEG